MNVLRKLTSNVLTATFKPLLNKLNHLTDSFNESLLSPTATTNSSQNDDDDQNSEEHNEDDIPEVTRHDPEYFESQQWNDYIQTALDSFTVPQPSMNSQSRQEPPSHVVQPSRPSSVTVPQHHNNNSTINSNQTSQSLHPQSWALNIQVAKMSLGSSGFCLLPQQLSQATLFGRNGSNACTFIALLMAKSYTTSTQYPSLQLNYNGSLNQTWLTLLSSILEGNQIYDRVTQSQGLGTPFFSVAAAKAHLTAVIAPTLEETLDLSFTSENPQIPQSSNAFYLQRLVRERNLAALVIINGMTVCFVGQNNRVYFLDRHPHTINGRVFGAVVRMTPVSQLEEFLLSIKRLISHSINVCSLSFASF